MYYETEVAQCVKCGHVQFKYKPKCVMCGGELMPADEETTNALREKHKRMCDESASMQINKTLDDIGKGQYCDENQHTPKCPTCGSTNIKKISTTSKVAGAAVFGLFSKTARSQFKCNNCGYKW